jgi:hypothetical protein
VIGLALALAGCGDAAWQDGELIAFSNPEEGITVITPDGGDQEEVVGRAHIPAWSPGEVIDIVDVDAGTSKSLANGSSPSWRPAVP